MASFGTKKLLSIIGVAFLLIVAGNFTNAMERDEYAFSHPEEAEAWLRERGIDGYGSNFFVFRYTG